MDKYNTKTNDGWYNNLVLDAGSGSPKFGVGGNTDPFWGATGFGDTSFSFAAERQSYGPTTPFVNGGVEDWDCIENALLDLYSENSIESDAHYVLLTGSEVCLRENAAQMFAEILFETLSVPGICACRQPVLSLASSWTSRNSERSDTGFVVEVGHSTTTLSSVIQGLVVFQRSLKFSGKDATACVQQLMQQRTMETVDLLTAEIVKVQYGYSCPCVELENQKHADNERYTKLHHLSSGSSCEVKHERFLGPETILTGLSMEVYHAIMSLPTEFQRDQFSNIVLAGGSSLFKDFGRRLERDLKRIHTSTQVNVISSHMRGIAAWFGGSMMACTSEFHTKIFDKNAYAENGRFPGVVDIGIDARARNKILDPILDAAEKDNHDASSLSASFCESLECDAKFEPSPNWLATNTPSWSVQATSRHALSEGRHIEIRWQGESCWLAGKVVECHQAFVSVQCTNGKRVRICNAGWFRSTPAGDGGYSDFTDKEVEIRPAYEVAGGAVEEGGDDEDTSSQYKKQKAEMEAMKQQLQQLKLEKERAEAQTKQVQIKAKSESLRREEERELLQQAEAEAMRRQKQASQKAMQLQEVADQERHKREVAEAELMRRQKQASQKAVQLQEVADQERHKREIAEAELERRSAEEREQLLSQRQDWDALVCPLPTKEQHKWEWDGPKQQYNETVLGDDDDFYDNIKDAWRRKNGKGKKNHLKIQRVVLVENTALRQQFGIGVHTMETRRHQSALFNEQLEDDGEKRILLERLKGYFEAESGLEKVNVIYAWHGCSHAAADAICSLGGADLRKTDGGFFGAGIYVTPHAEYAAGQYSAMNEPNASGEHVALLCLVSIGNAYPISRTTDYVQKDDYSALSVSKYHYAHPVPAGATIDFLLDHKNRQDKVLKAGFDAHFASISTLHSFQAVGPDTNHDYDEIVLKEERQVLPVAKVYFKPS
jgi:actin-related protein 3